MRMSAVQAGIGQASRNSLGFGCAFLRCGSGWQARSAGGERAHRRDGAQYSRQRRLRAAAAPVSERRAGAIPRCGAQRRARTSRRPRWRAALAYGDFDRDGDLDLLITTNQGPALLYRNDVTNGNRSHAPAAGGDQIESRCHRRGGAADHAGGDAVAHGEDGVELPVAIGAGADVRDWQGARRIAW